MNFCNTLSGFADFENAADRRVAKNFGLDSGLFMSGSLVCGYTKQSLDHFYQPSLLCWWNCHKDNETKLVHKSNIYHPWQSNYTTESFQVIKIVAV